MLGVAGSFRTQPVAARHARLAPRCVRFQESQRLARREAPCKARPADVQRPDGDVHAAARVFPAMSLIEPPGSFICPHYRFAGRARGLKYQTSRGFRPETSPTPLGSGSPPRFRPPPVRGRHGETRSGTIGVSPREGGSDLRPARFRFASVVFHACAGHLLVPPVRVRRCSPQCRSGTDGAVARYGQRTGAQRGPFRVGIFSLLTSM